MYISTYQYVASRRVNNLYGRIKRIRDYDALDNRETDEQKIAVSRIFSVPFFASKATNLMLLK